MTVCIAALCDGGKSLVLVADKMVDIGIIEAEPEIKKLFRVHRDWWVMVAGNDVSPAFDIIDSAKNKLAGRRRISIDTAISAVTESYKAKRLKDAEAIHLTPRGWTIESFRREGEKSLPETSFMDLDWKVAGHVLGVSLLVAGFDSEGRGHIFSLPLKPPDSVW